MKRGLADRRIWVAATWLAMLARCAWGMELPWTWEGRMEFGGERTEWVVDLDGAPERIEVCLEGGGGRFLVDEASWDRVWNGTPMGEFREGTGEEWMATKLDPDAVTRHLRFRSVGGTWVLTGVRVAGGDGETRVVFDKEDGFEVTEGADGVCIRARVVNGGGDWFARDAWECDAGAGYGDGGVFRVNTEMPESHWARVRAGCDGSDEVVMGTIRWRVAVAGEQGRGDDGSETPADIPVPRVVERASPPDVEERAQGKAVVGSKSVSDYYAGCYGTGGRLLSGEKLRQALCNAVNADTVTNGYGSWLNSMLEVTDACPTNDSMVQCIYLQRGITSFNKEHLWPQSHGIDSREPAYSDLHNLRTSDSTLNSTRGNLDFDDCRNEPDAKEKNGCWYTTKAWEPPDAAKGDVARAAMYMAVRYEEGATPIGDLELVEATGTGPGTNALGRLSTLLEWNELDPVDAFERRRNEQIYSRYQGNRNPFVDHPEWARRVFEPDAWSDREGVDVSVRELDARQRYPWNGLVDIDYELAIQGGRGDERAWVALSGLDGSTGKTIPVRTLEGPGATGLVPPGRYRMTWDMGTDAPDLVSDDFSLRMRAGQGKSSYWVIDMDGDTESEHWPVETWEGEPAGGWTWEHKTRKLVVRQIEAGTFAMGSPEGELGRREDETLHPVTLSRPYGLGVFQVTQKQWEFATGEAAPSRYTGDARPVECVSHGRVRGTALGTQWPQISGVDSESFLGILRAKTGIAFDLPTEAQWEHACRAGTSTALNSGKDLTGTDVCENLSVLGRYAYNGGMGDRHADVGSYAPNAWGLYDMHGNVWEWCLDWYDGTGADTSATDPTGPGNGMERVVRGGSWDSDAEDCRSARRGARNPAEADNDVGFRVACPMAGSKAQRMAFAPIGNRTVADRVELAATTSSGGEVTFSVVSGPGVVDGNELHFSGMGEVVVRARQEGDANWWPVNAEQSVTVVRAEQEMVFAAIGPRETTEWVTLAATTTGGGPIEFDVLSGPGELDGNVLLFTGTGTVDVRATQAGDEIWAPVSVTQTVRVVESGLLHTVTIADGILHGTFTADAERAAEGDIVTLNATPDEGWKLSGVFLDGNPLDDGSFTMPDHDVVVSACFTKRVVSVFRPVETEDEFELGASYLIVAEEPGVYVNALRNAAKSSRIGVAEVEIGGDGAIRTDSESIVWQIRPGTAGGMVTLYNEEARVYAAGPASPGNYAQLLEDGTSDLAQWWLGFSGGAEVEIHSLRYPDWWLSRNSDSRNDYFATYQHAGVLPRLYKKVDGWDFGVEFDKADGFVVKAGVPDGITAIPQNGTGPCTWAWTSATPVLNGSGPVLSIPETLPAGVYAVQVTVTDAVGQQTSKTIGFTVTSQAFKSVYGTITVPGNFDDGPGWDLETHKLELVSDYVWRGMLDVPQNGYCRIVANGDWALGWGVEKGASPLSAGNVVPLKRDGYDIVLKVPAGKYWFSFFEETGTFGVFPVEAVPAYSSVKLVGNFNDDGAQGIGTMTSVGDGVWTATLNLASGATFRVSADGTVFGAHSPAGAVLSAMPASMTLCGSTEVLLASAGGTFAFSMDFRSNRLSVAQMATNSFTVASLGADGTFACGDRTPGQNLEDVGDNWWEGNFIVGQDSFTLRFIGRDKDGIPRRWWGFPADTTITALPANGTLTAADAATNAAFATFNAGAGVYAFRFNPHSGSCMVRKRDSANLLQNPSFEELDGNGNPVGWGLYHAGAAPAAFYDAHSGTNAAVLTRLYGEWANLGNIDQNVTLKDMDGLTFRVAASFRCGGSAWHGDMVRIIVEWLDSSGSFLHEESTKIQNLSPSWQTVSLDTTVPGSNVTAHILFKYDGAQVGETVLIDDAFAGIAPCRTQNFDAWGKHDKFEKIASGWSVDSGKTILNAGEKVVGGVVISKYIESIGNTKAIELYNGTSSDINFTADHYYLQQYDNGATRPTVTIPLTNGTIPAGCTFAVTRTFNVTNYPPDNTLRQFGAIGGLANRILRTDKLTFNGDDVIVLRKGSASGRIVDRVGQVGANAIGSLWSRMATDHTLVRNGTVTNGNTNAVTAAFNLSEWTVLDNGDFGNLGTHAFTDPDAGYLPSGYSLLLDTDATLTTPSFGGGIGDISFLARAQGASSGNDLRLAIESAPDEYSSFWTTVATIKIPLSQNHFARFECVATDPAHTTVRFRHISDGTTNRIRLDDISIGRAHTARRTESFAAWTDEFYTTDGTHSRAQWTLCGHVASNGMGGTLAANLPVGTGYVRSPTFKDGIGQVSFALCRATINDTVQATLQTSADGGTIWTDVQTFTFGTGSKLSTNVSAWVCIPANGCARILGGGGTANAIVDNIFIALPSISRTLDFDDITDTNGLSLYNYNSYSCKGWTITDTAISAYINTWSGNSGLVRNGMITSPRMDNIGSISFMYCMGTYTGDDNARLKVEVSQNSYNWTTITDSLAGTSEWQSYDYRLGESSDWHYVRISQTTSGKHMFIDDISLNAFFPAPSVSLVSSLDPAHLVTNEMFRLAATVYPRNGADVLTVTGFVKYTTASVRWPPLSMTYQGAGNWVSEAQPSRHGGQRIISYASVWYGGIGAVPDNPGYAVTNLSTLASTVTVSTVRFGDVWINQLFSGRSGDDNATDDEGTQLNQDHEFIEICGKADTDISHWKIQLAYASATDISANTNQAIYASYTIPADIKLADRGDGVGTWLLADSGIAGADQLLSVPDPLADTRYRSHIHDTSGVVRLLDQFGSVMDTFSYDLDTHSAQYKRVRQNTANPQIASRSVGESTHDSILAKTTPSLVSKAETFKAASTDTLPFRVDARAARGGALEARGTEWAVWDTAWIEGTERVEVTLERPGGEVETLGGAEESKGHGSAEWTPGENEWGMFTLRLAAWDAGGELLDELLALRIRRVPAELAYAAWIAARGGSPETMPMEADTDADGASNWEEYVADTDPLNPEETFASRLEVLGNGTLRVIPSVVSTGRIYRARLNGDLLQDAVWQDLGPGRPGIGAELGDESGQTGFGAVGVSLP